MTRVEKFEFENVHYFRFGHSPIGKPILYTYIYFVDGLLIDTGQSHAKKEILRTVAELNVGQLFITHHHEDHSGNIEAIKAKFGCSVSASALCCEIMKDPPPISFAQKLVWGSRPSNCDLVPIVSDYLETPNHRFTIIPIPGHASDMVALYEPEEKWLFSADLYINSYIGYFLDNESIVQQIESIKKVLKLDFRVMFCSHSPQLENGRKKLEEKLQFLEGFNHSVVDLYEKGFNEKEIFKALKLKENQFVYLLSGKHLSKRNMVRSAIRDFAGKS